MSVIQSHARKMFTRPVVGMICLFVFGPIALLLSELFRCWNWPVWFTNFVHSIGIALIGSGVAAVLLKLLAMERYFLDAVVSVSTSEGAIQHMSIEAQQKLWHDLTTSIYLPHLHTASKDGGNPKIPAIGEDLRKAFAQLFAYDAKFYLEDSDRTLTFVWENREQKILKVIEECTLTIVPFSPKERISWKLESKVAGSADGVGLNVIDCYALPSREPVNHTVLPSSTKDHVTLKFEPEVSSLYDIYRKREVTWDVWREPFYLVRNSLVINHLRVRFVNNAQGLSLIMRGHGKDDDFSPVGTMPDEIEFGESAMIRNRINPLLPGQGFGLYIRLN